MKWLKLSIAAVVSLALFYGLNFMHGTVPPPGKFLNPFAGFWQNNARMDAVPTDLHLAGLQDTVRVVWDDRRVPHIFARNRHDLYFAQGYLTARDRLWQMEFQTHAAAGRLAEIVGKRALAYDLARRRTGMTYAAENGARAMTANPETRAVAEAYTAGVNAWIAGLSEKSLPLEYKILDYRPEAWNIEKCSLLLKYMAWTLSGYNNERSMSQTRYVLGDSAMAVLFPAHLPFTDPIIPAGSPWDFTPLQAPKPATGLDRLVGVQPDPGWPGPRPRDGSNNWAVAGKLTASGNPILCNDPHLQLTLPSIWYELQMVSPEVNVYGVSLPGAPAVIIGFNRDVAWGVTNAGTDVLDLYKIQFKNRRDVPSERLNGTSPPERLYQYAGDWLPAQPRLETIKIRGGRTVQDTVFYTRYGPVAYADDAAGKDGTPTTGLAMRWTAHDSSYELSTFLKLNRARNYDDYVDALADFDCPAQNFVFAAASGDIAIWHNGKFPLRWDQQGRYVSDGSDPAYDWAGWIPRPQVPHIKNPVRGFVSSANQNPTALDYPYYLGSDFESFERGARINQRLGELQQITPQDMVAMQSDVLDLHAQKLLPVLLERLDPAKLTDDERRGYDALAQWNYEDRADWIAPSLYEAWWDALNKTIWDEVTASRPDGARLRRPSRSVTLSLILQQQNAAHFTAAPQTSNPDLFGMPELALQSYQAGFRGLTEKHGAFGPAWSWGTVRGTDIRHLAQIPGLGRKHLPTSGSYRVIDAITESHGPSWRMVVATGPEVQAWGIYPGGQSGNPGSAFYDNMVDDWVAGKIYPLLYLQSPDEANSRIPAYKGTRTTEMRGEK